MVTSALPVEQVCEGKVANTPKTYKEIVLHFGKPTLVLSCRDFDERSLKAASIA